MQRFDYRAPRFLVDYPIRLIFEEAAIDGRCKEISTEGMRVVLTHPIEPESVVTVTMSFEDVLVELPAQVTHAETPSAGLKFIYKTDRQRKDLERLVTLMTASAKLPDPFASNKLLVAPDPPKGSC